MQPCRYLPVNSDSSTDINTFGREGHFIQLGHDGNETMAYVVDKSGQFVVTYPTLVKLTENRMSVLLEKVLSEMREKVSKRRWPQVEKNIIMWFEKSGLL